MSQLLEFRKEGVYCSRADVFIDPWLPVSKALITHAHADHSRAGMGKYLAHELSIPVMKHRLGDHIKTQSVKYGEVNRVNGVSFSFHPAGHIPGSAQIRVEYNGEVWAVSGDYKLEKDGISEPFEAVTCDHFITESTFGLPVFNWKEQTTVMQSISDWWCENLSQGINTVLFVYALGKAQRVLANLPAYHGNIFAHGAIYNTHQLFRNFLNLPEIQYLDESISKSDLKGSLILAPPSAMNSSWLKKLKPYSTGMASGWMALRGTRRRRNADRGFILSDHADWNGLNEAVKASGAQHVYVTHGYTDQFSRWLSEKGLDAQMVKTEFEGDLNQEES